MTHRESETAQHQRAKQMIAAACERGGYRAAFEAVGEGWRADVMASPAGAPDVRLAFEVQWSPLSYPDVLARQRRYAADGVRGCWFFRLPPRALQMSDPLRLRARRDLPLFHLFVNADSSFSVALNGRLHPLGAFVEALLRRSVRFCDSARAESAQLGFTFAPCNCPACGRVSHVYRVDGRMIAHCGAIFDGDAAMLGSLPIVRAAAESRAETDGYRLHVTGAGFACAACGARLAVDSVERAIYQSGQSLNARQTLPSMIEIALPAPISGKCAHWCYPSDGAWCCKG
jgi:hypothetical protein